MSIKCKYCNKHCGCTNKEIDCEPCDHENIKADLEAARKENAIQAAMIEAMADAMKKRDCPFSDGDDPPACLSNDCAECIKTRYREQAEKKESEK